MQALENLEEIASITSIGVAIMGIGFSLVAFLASRNRPPRDINDIKLIRGFVKRIVKWNAKGLKIGSVGRLAYLQQALRSGHKQVDVSGIVWPVVVAWAVILTVFIVVQRTLVLPVTVCVGLTLSSLLAIMLLYRYGRHVGSRFGWLRTISVGAALALVGMVTCTSMAWAIRLNEPTLNDQAMIALNVSSQYEKLDQMRSDLAAHQAELKSLEVELAEARKRADVAQLRYDVAQQRFICELDGTCGSGTPGGGKATLELQTAADVSLADKHSADAEVRRLLDDVNKARESLAAEQAELRRHSQALSDAGLEEQQRHYGLLGQLETFLKIVFGSPIGSLIVAGFAVAAWIFVATVRRRRSIDQHTPPIEQTIQDEST